MDRLNARENDPAQYCGRSGTTQQRVVVGVITTSLRMLLMALCSLMA